MVVSKSLFLKFEMNLEHMDKKEAVEKKRMETVCHPRSLS